MPSDPHSFDEIKLPFIFVPHGAPEPPELLGGYADWIKLPATFVPDAHGDGQSNRSSGGPPPSQRRSADGLAASSDPAAPWPLAGNAMSDAMSAGTNGTSGDASIPDDPIAAFRLADDALATAASGHAPGYGLGQVGSAAAGISPVDGPIQQEPLARPPVQQAPLAPPPGAALPPPPMHDSDTWPGELLPFKQPGFVPGTNGVINFDTHGLIQDPTMEKEPPEIGLPRPSDIDT